MAATKNYGAVEVERAYLRARELCQQFGETTRLAPVLWALSRLYSHRGEGEKSQELMEQLLGLAETSEDPALLVQVNFTRGARSFWQGELTVAREFCGQGVALYDPQLHDTLAFLYGSDSGVACGVYLAFTLWHLGYPDKAHLQIQKSLRLAEGVAQPFSVVFALASSA